MSLDGHWVLGKRFRGRAIDAAGHSFECKLRIVDAGYFGGSGGMGTKSLRVWLELENNCGRGCHTPGARIISRPSTRRYPVTMIRSETPPSER